MSFRSFLVLHKHVFYFSPPFIFRGHSAYLIIKECVLSLPFRPAAEILVDGSKTKYLRHTPDTSTSSVSERDGGKGCLGIK